MTPDADDRRQRVAQLTANGRRTWRRLEQRAQQAAEQIVEPLSASQRHELASALATAERLLRAATVTFEPADPTSDDADVALTACFDELNRRFADGFDVHAAGADDPTPMGPPDGTFIVVRSDDAVIGCGAVQRVDTRTAEIKRMWVHSDWRGLGLGGRLLNHLERQAVNLDYRQVVLDTNGSLLEAIAMNERAGYDRTDRYNDNPYAQHWFTKRLPAAP